MRGAAFPSTVGLMAAAVYGSIRSTEDCYEATAGKKT